jgi:hypothetical protein
MHLFKHRSEPHSSLLVCVLCIPAHQHLSDLLTFFSSILSYLQSLRVVRDTTPNQYMLLLKFKDKVCTYTSKSFSTAFECGAVVHNDCSMHSECLHYESHHVVCTQHTCIYQRPTENFICSQTEAHNVCIYVCTVRCTMFPCRPRQWNSISCTMAVDTTPWSRPSASWCTSVESVLRSRRTGLDWPGPVWWSCRHAPCVWRNWMTPY